MELEGVLQVAGSAFDMLDANQRDDDILADISAMTGLMWAYRGFLDKASVKLRQAHELRARAEPFDHLELSWTEINPRKSCRMQMPLRRGLGMAAEGLKKSSSNKQ